MSARNNGPPRMSRSSNSCSRKMIRSNGNERVVTELGCHTSANGTFETCRDVRYSVVIRGKADVAGTPPN
jgi:hypothetical protein